MTDSGPPEGARDPRPLDEARRWLPAPVLLTAVALAQLLLSEQGPLHRWKGGGFAMFASNEERVLQVHIARGDQCLSHRAAWPEELGLAQDRLANFPTEAGLRGLGEELGGGGWRFYFDARESEDLRMTPAWAADRLGTHMAFPASFDSVQIDAWRLRFRPEGEDRNLNGRLDHGEDLVPNGYLDAPLVVPEQVRRWSSAEFAGARLRARGRAERPSHPVGAPRPRYPASGEPLRSAFLERRDSATAVETP